MRSQNVAVAAPFPAPSPSTARFNEPRIGRIHIACGLDAVDGAFSTLFGPANLSWFQVWTYQIDPAEVNLGDPIDMAKRLDGTPTLRYPPRVACVAIRLGIIG